MELPLNYGVGSELNGLTVGWLCFASSGGEDTIVTSSMRQCCWKPKTNNVLWAKAGAEKEFENL